MNAEIIAVGTELLLGQIVNLDAQFLSVELSKLGIDVYYHTVVGDNPKRLAEAVKTAFSRADLVLFSGGLGPTKDDLTKETVADFLGIELEFDQASYDVIVDYHKRLGRPIPENNRKQAMMPKGGVILKNNNGTAPGCIMAAGGKTAVLMPGPPSELKQMYTESVAPYLQKLSGGMIYSKVLRIFGIGESKLEQEIMDLIDSQQNPTIAPYAKEGEVTLRISAKAKNQAEADGLIAGLEQEIRRRYGDMVYAEGDDNSLCQVAAGLLLETGTTLAVAESCTGGLVASQLTDIAGISQVFLQGAVTYTNQAKEQALGVCHETLLRHGAVSEETAREMARGMKKAAGSDLALAITGIAGPGGGTPEKPVGLVYVALADGENEWVRELHLAGNRARVRNTTVLHAFDMVRQYFLKKK